MTELNIKTRGKDSTPDALRATGLLPAVFYGPKEENTPITVDAKEFGQIWAEAGGSAIVDLKGVGEDKEVLIQDVSVDPVTGVPIHADFYCIERGKKLTITVPLNFIGEAPVEKEGGIVVKVMHEIEIVVRPRDIPQEIEVDVTTLGALDSNITIADLKLSEEIEPTAELTDNVASVTQPQEEKVEEERDITDIEIEGEGETEEGEENKEE